METAKCDSRGAAGGNHKGKRISFPQYPRAAAAHAACLPSRSRPLLPQMRRIQTSTHSPLFRLCPMHIKNGPWVGNCVGYQNHKYFINFLWFAVAGMGYAALLFIVRLVGLISHVSMVIRERKIKGEPENLSTLPGEGEGGILDIPMVSVTICVINLIIIIPLVLSILCLLVYQLNLICENLTSIEEFEKKSTKKAS
jgi:hypothetical protein